MCLNGTLLSATFKKSCSDTSKKFHIFQKKSPYSLPLPIIRVHGKKGFGAVTMAPA